LTGEGEEPAEDDEKEAGPIHVCARLTVDWKLESKPHEEHLVTVHGLRAELEKLDLSGLKGGKEADAVLEALSRLQGMQGHMPWIQTNNLEAPGRLAFHFFADLAAADLDEVHALAFRRATARASAWRARPGVSSGSCSPSSTRRRATR
jgi:hypothetical protein